MKSLRLCLALTPLALAIPASSQTIERMRLSDGDLSCQQIYAEIGQMDTMIKVMASAPAAPVAQAAPVTAAPANPLAGLGGNAQANSQLGALSAAMAGAQGNGGVYDHSQVAALMRMSDDPKIRAAANDPAAVAQMASVMQNPQAYAAMARARQAGVSSGTINSQMALLQGLQGVQAGVQRQAAAQGQVPLSASAGGNNEQIARNIAAQGQAYQSNLLAGQNWQAALANAQGAQAPAAAQAAAPAPAPAPSGLGGLLGAIASARGSGSGGAQAASLFGSLVGGGQQQAAQAPAPAAPAPLATAPAAGHNIVAQAQGRKEHLTSLFLQRGCKMSEVSR